MLRLLLGLLAALLLAMAVVAAAPARLLAWVVPVEQVRLEGYSGRLWNGSVQRCLVKLPQGFLNLGELRWTLQPSSMLRLAPRLSLDSEWGDQYFTGEVVLRSSQAWELNDARARFDAALVQQFAPLFLRGDVELQVQSLRMNAGFPEAARGQMVWREGSWQSPAGNLALGSYVLDVAQNAGEPLQGEVVTLEGPLQVEGEVGLDGRTYRIDLRLHSEQQMDPILSESLALMATPRGDGYHLQLESEF